MSESQIYFPLRSNAHALLAGQPALSVLARVKIASLLHDRVLVEAGQVHISAGPTGSSVWRSPPAKDLSGAWQTPRDRARATGQPFYVAMRPSGAPADQPGHAVVHSVATLSWNATFEPLVRELPQAYPWFVYGNIANRRQAEDLAQAWIDADKSDLELAKRFQADFVRDTVVTSANVDLASAISMSAAVSLDKLHSRLVGARVLQGVAEPVFGARALELTVPDLARLSWSDIDDWRGHRGVQDYRAMLRDIEAAVVGAATSSVEIDSLIQQEFASRLREAAMKVKGSMASRASMTVLTVTISWIVGQIAGHDPLASTVLSGLAGFGASQITASGASPRWLAAHESLRARLSRGRTQEAAP